MHQGKHLALGYEIHNIMVGGDNPFDIHIVEIWP